MKIGLLGATGAVGQQMLQCMEERNIPVEELRVFASERSKGQIVKFNGRDYTLDVAKEDSFEGLDIVLGAVSNALSRTYAPWIKKSGAVYIDNSSAFRLDQDVPLVVPSINPQDIFTHQGIIANPNCSSIITCMAVYPLAKISPIRRMVASTYQAVSGAGNHGIVELETEIEALRNGEEFRCETFPHQIAYNCIPMIGSLNDDGYTTEEMKMENEGRKIMHLPELKVTCTCVRVPVMRSHSISVSVETERKITVDEAREAIRKEPSLRLKDGDQYPMPLNTTDGDIVEVGRIRDDRVFEKGLSLFCCGDQIRTGAAANAIEILQVLMGLK